MRNNKRRGSERGEKSDFIRLTGLWRPEKGKKHLGQGMVRTKDIEALLEAIEDKGGDGAFLFLFKNEYAESERDPRYVISALPLEEREDDDNDDEEPRRRSRKKRPTNAKRPKKRRDEEEDDDDGGGNDDDDDEVPF